MRGAQVGVLDAINNKDEKVASVVATLRGPSGNRDRLDEAGFLVWPQRKGEAAAEGVDPEHRQGLRREDREGHDRALMILVSRVRTSSLTVRR